MSDSESDESVVCRGYKRDVSPDSDEPDEEYFEEWDEREDGLAGPPRERQPVLSREEILDAFSRVAEHGDESDGEESM